MDGKISHALALILTKEPPITSTCHQVSKQLLRLHSSEYISCIDSAMKQKFGCILLNQMPFVTRNRNTFIPFGTNASRTELAGPEFSATIELILVSIG